jgi:hypothetical protein
MMGPAVTDFMLIEAGARGGMLGELGEWPYLRDALKNYGHPLPPDTPAQEVVSLCRQLIDEDSQA